MLLSWVIVGCCFLGTSAQAQDPVAPASVRLFMPDAQLVSHVVRVYLSENIAPTDEPKLALRRSRAVTAETADESMQFLPILVAPAQEWIERVNGVDVRRSGTLLLFNLKAIDFQFKAMIRVMPIVTWSGTRAVVGEHEVNLGNLPAAMAWTGVIVAVTLAIIAWLGWRAQGSPIHFLIGVDGHLSLAQTQVACWTVVIGSAVLGYGMIRLTVPEIPTSLVVLMGASLVTGGVGYLGDVQKKRKAVMVQPSEPAKPKLGDLVRVFPPGQPPELSLAKAQMLFWTIILLLLFISKSTLDGALWDVPWGLVALMGFSQVGFLAPKIALPA